MEKFKNSLGEGSSKSKLSISSKLSALQKYAKNTLAALLVFATTFFSNGCATQGPGCNVYKGVEGGNSKKVIEYMKGKYGSGAISEEAEETLRRKKGGLPHHSSYNPTNNPNYQKNVKVASFEDWRKKQQEAA